MSAVIVVIGARGATGKLVCSQAIKTEGVKEVRAVVRRNDGTVPTDPKLKLIEADVLNDAAKMDEVLTGATHIIYAAAGTNKETCIQVDNIGVAKVSEAAKKHGLKRVILVSSQMVDPVNYWNFIRGFLNTLVWGIMDEKFKGENALKASGIDYTIIRPGQLVDGEVGATGKVVFGKTNSRFMGTPLCRNDVARTCLAAVFDDAFSGQTIEIAGDRKQPSQEHLKLELSADS